jgi:hypothetical protein
LEKFAKEIIFGRLVDEIDGFVVIKEQQGLATFKVILQFVQKISWWDGVLIPFF